MQGLDCCGAAAVSLVLTWTGGGRKIHNLILLRNNGSLSFSLSSTCCSIGRNGIPNAGRRKNVCGIILVPMLSSFSHASVQKNKMNCFTYQSSSKIHAA